MIGKQKQTILILHGWGLSGERYTGLQAIVEKGGYRVFAPDFPGFGKSAIPQKPLNLEDYAEFLHTYIEKNKIKHPIVIGHSFGGRVALRFTEIYPNIIQALILTGTPGFTPIPKRRLALFILIAKIGGIFFSVPPLSLFHDYIQRWYYYAVGAKEFFRAKGAMRETFKRVVREDLVSSMEALTIPCLLVWGEYDIIIPISIAERMKHVIPQAELVIIPEADHGVPFKEPQIFVQYVDRFIASL